MSATAPTAGRFPPTPPFQADRALRTLVDRAPAWAALSISDRVGYLTSLSRRFLEVAPAMVADGLRAKGVDDRYSGEEWVSGPVTALRTIRFLIDTLEHIDRTGRVPVSDRMVAVRPDGQVTIRVVPADRWDRILYRGLTADVWLDPGIERASVHQHLGSFYTKEAPPARVGLVLGAGNVASIGPLDVVHKLFVDGATAMLKFNPVNDYIGPHVERAMADLITDGFVRTAYGGGETGEHLVRHPGVSEIHITGAARTHDTIIWGPGQAGERRRSEGAPLVDKPITSELGNVSPVIVVPGPWKDRDLRFHAEHLATQMMQNDGFNCNAAKVILLHRGWAQRAAFLDRLRGVLAELPERPAYYPGAEQRFDRFVTAHPAVELLGERTAGVVPPALLLGVNAEFEHLAFTEEAFCSLAAVTDLGGGDAAEFLDAAVAFCNGSLEGTLNATILVDPASRASLGSRLDGAVAALRYGTIGINVWAAAGFVLGVTPWGGYPGATIADVQSGIGFVHNARLIDRPQKTVVDAPFRQYPKPPWFVTHRNSSAALLRAARLEASPSMSRVPGLLAAAIRG